MLELENIEYYYPSQKDKMILDGVSYCFEEGRMYAVLGASGCGKTTLLSLMAGLDVPVAGRILIDGKELRKNALNLHRKNDVSLIFQNYNLIDYLKPVENVKLGGKADAARLLAQMGIDAAQRQRNVLQLSGGQQQRVAIARALAGRAPVLLADEPTGNLDEDTANEIIAIFRKLAHEQGKCVIVVTHSRELAQQADVILQLRKGKLSEEACESAGTEDETGERKRGKTTGQEPDGK